MQLRPFAFVFLFFAGCSTVQDSSRSRIAPPSEDKAVVYFIHDMPAVGDGAVFANGTRLVALGDRMYTWYYVEPGRYDYSLVPLDPAWHGQAAAASSLELKAGKRYYVSVSWYKRPEPPVLEAIVAPIVEPLTGPKPYKPPRLIMLSEPDALSAMQRCRLVDSIP